MNGRLELWEALYVQTLAEPTIVRWPSAKGFHRAPARRKPPAFSAQVGWGKRRTSARIALASAGKVGRIRCVGGGGSVLRARCQPVGRALRACGSGVPPVYLRYISGKPPVYLR